MEIGQAWGSRRGSEGTEELVGAEFLRFGRFRFDRRRGVLLRQNEDGQFVPVPIGSRALDILGLLSTGTETSSRRTRS